MFDLGWTVKYFITKEFMSLWEYIMCLFLWETLQHYLQAESCTQLCTIKCWVQTTKTCISLFVIMSYMNCKRFDLKSNTDWKYDKMDLCIIHLKLKRSASLIFLSLFRNYNSCIFPSGTKTFIWIRWNTYFAYAC